MLIFGGLSIAILLLFQLSKFSLTNGPDSGDIFIIISGLLFIAIGFLINRFFNQGSKKEMRLVPDQQQLNKTQLSKQEYKVLSLMSDGLSNIEIAERLFIAESTVKTHVSRILGKLNAKRRTEAVKIGRDLQII